jgi:hypothetical protein
MKSGEQIPLIGNKNNSHKKQVSYAFRSSVIISDRIDLRMQGF